MADVERELEQPGMGEQAPKTTERWVHRHGAAGERVEKYAGDPDPELSFTGVIWTAVGIAGTTVLAMVLMVWMLGGLTDFSTAREPAPTPAEQERREAVRRAGEERVVAEPPGLAVPPELEVPPEPRLELHPTWNLEELRKVEKDLLEEWADVHDPAGAVRIPIETAIELAAAGELPGVPRGTEAAPSGAEPGGQEDGEAAAGDAEQALREAGDSGLGTGAVTREPGEEPAAAEPLTDGPATEEPHGE